MFEVLLDQHAATEIGGVTGCHLAVLGGQGIGHHGCSRHVFLQIRRGPGAHPIWGGHDAHTALGDQLRQLVLVMQPGFLGNIALVVPFLQLG
ncbi:hypothetical protein D3C76_1137660 [compost metagenome]